jgi:elongation factor 3
MNFDFKADAAKAMENLKAAEKQAKAVPFVLAALDSILQFFGDKKCTADLRTKITASLEEIASNNDVNEPAIKDLGVPVAMNRAVESTKWQEKVMALRMIEMWAESAPDAVTDSMVSIVPKLSSLFWDSKPEVKNQAKAALTAACRAIDNIDLAPFIPNLIRAISEPETVEDCIYALAATTFVQAVKAPALSITVPLLERGFKERKVATIRQCAKISENLAKLVADPVDVAPFLPVLGPALAKAKVDVSDPECRSRCAAAHDALLAIGSVNTDQQKALDASVSETKAKVKEVVATNLKGQPEPLIKYVEAALTGLLSDKERPNAESWVTNLTPSVGDVVPAKTIEAMFKALSGLKKESTAEVFEDDTKEGEDVLCDCRFSLAYGSKILLNSARLKLLRGRRYGLVASKAAGKTTLLKAIANNQLEGFPGPDVCKTVFVEDDIAGSDSKYGVVQFVLNTVGEDGVTEEMVRKGLQSVGFDDHHLNLPVSSLSGGWRIKTAVARAMLRNADILLMDQPTNHLDVKNVQWVVDYLTGEATKKVTCLIVTHDVDFANKVLTNTIFFTPTLKLDSYSGNLEAFFQKNPDARAMFDLSDSKDPFNFPVPAPIEGLKAKGSKCMSMENVNFTYPGAPRPQLENVNIRVSMASRVCCAGANGAGKSTLIKLLTGALTPSAGVVWRHPNVRIAYVGQHAFEYVENHLQKTPNEYIRWRYDGGDDKEALNKSNMLITPEEQALMDKPMEVTFTDEEGKTQKEKRVIERLMGRRKEKTGLFYEAKFKSKTQDQNIWMDREELIEKGFEKMVLAVDRKKLAAEGAYTRTLSARNVEEHLIGVGLDSEAATHTRIAQLSSGQKIKVVLAAALWYLPHILILDEPTNYASREDSASLAKAMNNWAGGIVLITHSKAFADLTTRENWIVQNYKCEISGEADWVALEKEALELGLTYKEEQLDVAGNKIDNKKKRDPNDIKPRDKKVMMKELKRKIDAEEELTEWEYTCATAWSMWA